MAITVTIVGLLIIAAGVVIAIAPKRFAGWISSLDSVPRFWTAVLIRVAIGVTFLFAAPSSRVPLIVEIVGVLVLVAAFAILVLGRARVDALLAWFVDRPTTWLRLGSIAALGFGGLLIYAGA